MTHAVPDSSPVTKSRFSPPQTALSIDIGGGTVRMAVVSRGGVVAARVTAPLRNQGDPDALKATLHDLLGQLERMCPLPADFVGIAIPGIWERSSGIMRTAVNLPRLVGVNIREFFETTLQRNAVIDTDVNAAAWAQWRQLNPSPARFAYLSLGTGVGGAVILDGQLVRHTNGGAGHFGFLIVNPADTQQTPHYVPGSLSAIASGPALQAASGTDARSPLEHRGVLSSEALKRGGEALAIGIVQIVHMYMPDVIVLGGGVVDHHPQLVDETQKAFESRRTRLTPEAFHIERAKLPSDEAGVVGAALLALARWGGN